MPLSEYHRQQYRQGLKVVTLVLTLTLTLTEVIEFQHLQYKVREGERVRM